MKPIESLIVVETREIWPIRTMEELCFLMRSGKSRFFKVYDTETTNGMWISEVSLVGQPYKNDIGWRIETANPMWPFSLGDANIGSGGHNYHLLFSSKKDAEWYIAHRKNGGRRLARFCDLEV